MTKELEIIKEIKRLGDKLKATKDEEQRRELEIRIEKEDKKLGIL